MDPLRYKRPGTQKQGQITNTNLRNSPPVAKVLLTRPLRAAPVTEQNVGRRLPELEAAPHISEVTQAPKPVPAAQPIQVSPQQISPTQPAPFQQPKPAPIATQPQPLPVQKPQAVQALQPTQAQPAQLQPRAVRVAQQLQAKPAPESVAAPAAPTQAPAKRQLSQPATRSLIDMSLPGEESPAHWDSTLNHKKWGGARRWGFRGAALAIILVVTLGGLVFSQSYLKANKVFKGSSGTAEALKSTVNPDLLKGEGSGRVNILLLGRGGGTHDAPDLTDTIMIASIDPVNHSTTLFSLPRDLWVNVPDAGVMKLNAAWQTGVWKSLGKHTTGSSDPTAIKAGFALADQTIKDVTGVEINYNVIVDFKAFEQAVDTVGGVSIDSPNDLVDPTMAWENANNPILAKAGINNFDGKHALIYSRSRETTSDFARAQRQRQMLVALKTKMVDLGTLSNPVKISKLLGAFGDNVKTDLSMKNATRLYQITKDIPDSKTTSISLADEGKSLVSTANIAGQSVVIPKSGLYKYEEIQQFLRTQLKDPYMIREAGKVLILNGTLIPGLATNKSAELSAYGYNVIGTGNTPTGGWTQFTVVDLTGGKKKYTRHFLEQRFGVSAINSLSDKSIPTNGADFVIIIGSNEATSR